jgi:hypothetical protein
MSIREAYDWFDELPGAAHDKQNEIAARILKEIRERLKLPQRCRPGIPDAVAQSPARCRAAKASASGLPRRSAPA